MLSRKMACAKAGLLSPNVRLPAIRQGQLGAQSINLS